LNKNNNGNETIGWIVLSEKNEHACDENMIMQRERNNDVQLCICEWETQKRGRSFADAATFEL
jgi:hypothetical protein